MRQNYGIIFTIPNFIGIIFTHAGRMIDRLKQFIETENISISALEKKISASDGMIRRAIRNSTDIQSKWLEKISDNYPDLNLTWLITGKGQMLKKRTPNVGESNDLSPGRERISVVCEPIEKYRIPTLTGIPLLPINAIAGFFADDTSVLNNDCTYYNVPLFHGADFMISVRGESMIPNFLPGDIVACQFISNESYIQWGRVYVFDTDQGPIIKRIKPSINDDSVLITSDNPEYAPFVLKKESIRRMALVLGFMRPD